MEVRDGRSQLHIEVAVARGNEGQGPMHESVVPANAGTQRLFRPSKALGPRFRGDDGYWNLDVDGGFPGRSGGFSLTLRRI
jgi:hypothetical protein